MHLLSQQGAFCEVWGREQVVLRVVCGSLEHSTGAIHHDFACFCFLRRLTVYS